MTRMKLPAAQSARTAAYGSFRGVDFSVDPSLVDKRRSPYAPNMISDDGGNPVKRRGWRVLHRLPEPINGLFHAELSGRSYLLAHAGTTLQVIEGDSVKEVYTGLVNARSCAFYMSSTGEETPKFDSKDYKGSYPKKVTLSKGTYSIKITGGKGENWVPRSNIGSITGKGGAGGTIVFDLKLEGQKEIEIRKITNGSDEYRVSYHLYIDNVLYAASGGGGDGGPDAYAWEERWYSGATDGGAGGGKNGQDGGNAGSPGVIPPKGGQGAAGGTGGRWTKANKYFSGTNGGDGSDYSTSTGGTGQGKADGTGAAGRGGCGYAGGGGNSKALNDDQMMSWWSGTGGGSSFLIGHEAVTKVEDSQGTNPWEGYVKIKRKADDYQRLYILTGREYLVFDGETVKEVRDEAYIPKVIISRKPTGGGEFYEAVNLLTAKRTESFLGDGTSKTFQLTAITLDDDPVTVRIANEQGDYDSLTEGNGFTVDRVAGKVTFTEAHAPVVVGQDNILITYAKTVSGYADKIRKCTAAATFGIGGDNRVFLSGNPDFKAYDYWSDLYRPNYFPDLNYAVIGANNTAVMGYQKMGEYLGIVKEDNQQDTTVFLRSGFLSESGNAVFSVKQSISGIGAISKYCFAALADEPMFLSRMGIYAAASTLMTGEWKAKNRSYFIDKELKAEPNLEEAAACQWNGYYLLGVNGNVYLLDSRHQSGEKNGNSDFVYECYHWTDVPAYCWLSVRGELYFGTKDGRVCKFNTDELPNAKMTIYSDGGTLEPSGRIEGGAAIDSAWFTPNDDDGAAYLYKTLQRKGSLVTISPYDRSSAEICYIADGNPEEFVRLECMDIFDWEDIDFERFTFNSSTSPQDVYFGQKKKRYKRLQIGIRNRQINEGFGIHQIVKCFKIGNYSKNRRY